MKWTRPAESTLCHGGSAGSSTARHLRDGKSAAEYPVRVLGAERVAVYDEVGDARRTWSVQVQRPGRVNVEAVVDTVEPRDSPLVDPDQR